MVLFDNPNLVFAVALPAGIGALVSMALLPKLIKKFDEKKVYIGLSVYGFIASIVNYYMVIWTKFNIPLLLVLQFIYGLQFGVLNIPLIMVADSVDYYEHKTGKRTEGVSYGIYGLAFKVSLALMTAVALLLIDAFGYSNYVPGTVSEEMDAIRKGIWFTRIFVPGISSILAVIPILFYNLVGGTKKKINDELVARREKTVTAEAE